MIEMACVAKRRNRYVLDFRDQFGVRQWITTPKGTTKAKAEEELRRKLDQVKNGVFRPDSKTLLFSEVAQDWLEHKKPNLRETTWEVYEGHVKNHFHDLDGLKINRISIATAEKFITSRQIQGMNIGTLRKVLVTLGQIFSFAVRRRYLDHNPLRDAERPRRQDHCKEEGNPGKEPIRFLTPPQVRAFLDQVSDSKYLTLFMTAIFTGARQGELLGLKWQDVDWETGQIHIQRTFNNGRFFATKTKASNRKVDLGPAMLTELKKWKLACPKNEHDLVFPNEAGRPMNNKNMLRRHFRPAIRAAGCPPIRFHDLRHTNASIRIANEESIKYIQNQLGHASPSITLNVYAHLLKPTNPDAACRLENAILGGSGSKMVANKRKGSRPRTVTP
jgi:integrase